MNNAPATLIISKNKKTQRIINFESRSDALDVAERFENAGFTWSIHTYEHIPKGELPPNIPPRQLKMF